MLWEEHCIHIKHPYFQNKISGKRRTLSYATRKPSIFGIQSFMSHRSMLLLSSRAKLDHSCDDKTDGSRWNKFNLTSISQQSSSPAQVICAINKSSGDYPIYRATHFGLLYTVISTKNTGPQDTILTPGDISPGVSKTV